ncbi:MAG: hypothetical protein K6G15_05770 [Desulfovibrio sp.]|nr:hypothetical protein [Desulfovibrio sp.]
MPQKESLMISVSYKNNPQLGISCRASFWPKPAILTLVQVSGKWRAKTKNRCLIA